MRAPPVAVKQTNGRLWSSAACTPRTKRSPTTEPIEPPMNSNSKAAATSGTFFIAPCITTSASVSPVSFSASSRRSGYLRESRNFRVSTGVTSVADLEPAFRVEQEIEPRTRGDAVVVAALRADVGVLLEIGRVEHRVARRALAPQPLRHLALVAAGALDLGRQQFLRASSWTRASDADAIIAASDQHPTARCRFCPGCVANRRAPVSTSRARSREASRSAAARPRCHLLDEPAADDHRVGDGADRARRRAVADPEADADRQRGLAPDGAAASRRRRRRRGATRR